MQSVRKHKLTIRLLARNDLSGVLSSVCIVKYIRIDLRELRKREKDLESKNVRKALIVKHEDVEKNCCK